MKIVRSLIVLVLKMFADDGILVLLNAEVEVTACVAYIIRITQIAFKLIHNALLIYFIWKNISESLVIRNNHVKKKTYSIIWFQTQDVLTRNILKFDTPSSEFQCDASKTLMVHCN